MRLSFPEMPERDVHQLQSGALSEHFPQSILKETQRSVLALPEEIWRRLRRP